MLAQFLLLDKDAVRFARWFRNTTTPGNAINAHSRECFDCLDEWCRNYNM